MNAFWWVTSGLLILAGLTLLVINTIRGRKQGTDAHTDATAATPAEDPEMEAAALEQAVADWESEGGAFLPPPDDLDDDEDPAAGINFSLPIELDTPENQIRRMWIDIGGEGDNH